jgi:5,10-methylenetetrahydromethanopterin reductase
VRDALCNILSLALHTDRIKLGTSVIDVYRRHPVQIAATVATIDEISGGRIILGLGAGAKTVVEPLGIKWKGSRTPVLESVRIIREILRGESVSYDGNIYQLRDAKLFFKPIRNRIPIYLGPISQMSLQLGGQIADGVILSGFVSTDYVRYAIENIQIGAEKVGRDIKDIDIACLLETCVTENMKIVRQAFEDHLLSHLTWQPFDVVLRQSGDWLMNQVARVRNASAESKSEAMSYVTDKIIDHLTVSGSPSNCSKRIKEYISAGVKLPIIRVWGRNIPLAIETASKD